MFMSFVNILFLAAYYLAIIVLASISLTSARISLPA